MAIVGFNFEKISAEKKDAIKGKIDIKNNVSIDNVDEKKISFGSDKQKVLSFTFEFTSKYDPEVALIRLVGDVLYMEEAKKAKDIIDGWRKDKRLPKDIVPSILNAILNKCHIQALFLSEQINLPPPVQLPKLQFQQKSEEKQ